MLSLRFLGSLRDVGFLIMRVGLGLAMMIHGSGKMFGGPEVWTQVGAAIQNIGISFGHPYWGFLSALAEFGGGILFILGFLFRPGAILLTFNMAIAVLFHLKHGDNFNVYSHALELGIVFLGLIFMGPGRFSIDGD